MKSEENLRVGSGVINSVTEVLSSACIEGKVLYVSDSRVDSLYGAIVKEQIRRCCFLEEVYVTSNTIAYAKLLGEKAVDLDVNCIVGLGGGSVLDVCKYAAFTSQKQLLLIPTTAANDGIASPVAVLKDETGKPKSLLCNRASMMLVDTELIFNAPLQLIKAGVGDIISNYMALLDWELACNRGKDRMNGYAYLMSQNALNILLKSKYNNICKEFVEELLNAHVLSGIAMDFTKSSRAVSGSEHLFSHALDYYSDVKNLHGIQTGLGTIAVLKLIGEDYKEVLDCLKRYQIDINPERLGISEESFVYCMQHASEIRQDRYTYLHEIELCDKHLRDVYKQLVKEL